MQILPKRNTLKHLAVSMAFAALSGIAFAQTGLTTVQDTLFTADGGRFSGTITIHWSTFDVNNAGTIVQQNKVLRVSNGNLQVQLAPNAGAPPPANEYAVQYQSDGFEQFSETWMVPVSALPLRVADVRTGGGTSSSGGSGAVGNQTPIVEASVVGLVPDLAQRPVKGPGFGTGAVALVNPNGQIDTVVGNVGDCVYVDGTTGPCGGQTATLYDGEVPAGAIDGTNTAFTLLSAPSGASLTLFRNGVYLTAGVDYTLNGAAIQFVAAAVPQPQDALVASYRVDPAGNIGNLDGPTLHATAAQVLCSAGGRLNNRSAWSSLGSCDIPAAGLKPGDRIEIRFTFAHTGKVSGFDVQVNWGTSTVLARHGGAQDVALAGQAEASLGNGGAQLTVQSWGTVLSFLPGIVGAPLQNGLRVDFRGAVTRETGDTVSLVNYTVLRYPGN